MRPLEELLRDAAEAGAAAPPRRRSLRKLALDDFRAAQKFLPTRGRFARRARWARACGRTIDFLLTPNAFLNAVDVSPPFNRVQDDEVFALNIEDQACHSGVMATLSLILDGENYSALPPHGLNPVT